MRGEPRVVLDCRWLGIGGAGRTTELVLRGLAEAPPPAGWVLWGDADATAALAWPGADVEHVAGDPRRLLGQRHTFELPRGDFFVFLHQQRPLRPVPSATVIYDTIPLRYGSGRPVRALKRLFLRTVARSSRRVITISEHSRRSIVRDLRVAADRVHLVHFPFDRAFVERVHSLRASAPRAEMALFIGNFLPHKNVPRLVSAFAATRFRHDGGGLVLVGASASQATKLLDRLAPAQRRFVTVRHSCTQAEIDELYATSLFLVQPSLEEGFGLPAWEALCCGLPVCVSDGGALPEVVDGFADPFPADSEPAMAAAIDACAVSARAVDADHALRQSRALTERAPTLSQFGAEFRRIVSEALAAGSACSPYN